jgi:signal transduction histidine kinase
VVVAPTAITEATSGRTRGPLALGVAVLSLALVIVSLVASPHQPNRAAWIVCAGVILCWAAAGVTTARSAPTLGTIISAGAFLAAAAAGASRIAYHNPHDVHGLTHVIALFAASLAMAVSVHVLLSLPTGVLGARTRQVTAALWYVAALVLGAYLATTTHLFAPWPVSVAWGVTVLSTLPGLYARYSAGSAWGRQQLQCFASGLVLTLIGAIFAATFHLLVAWPRHVTPTMIGVTCLVPLGLIAGTSKSASRADRLLVHLLAVLGWTVVVSASYLVALRGLDKAPLNGATHEVLAWSIAAAAAASVVYLAIRAKFVRMATSFIYGAREAPDEVVRTFGSRLTRAIPMDELLLQLVESLRKTLVLTSAEIYTGTGEVLELVVSVPDIGSRSIKISGDEREVIARAGVSGNAWASVWIPGIVTGRPVGPLRVAPISHAGELLGIIVVTRAEGAVVFREEDDRVLTELTRQVGLAMHNAQLDTALQGSLDELRRQADELRASRARVVASGDAERRRVERNLHDGAQQHLVALAINLRLAKDVVVEDPKAAVEMLEELGVAVQDTIKELRELAHGIYPPLLVDSGLTEALRAVANRSPLDVDLITEGIGRYGRDIEAAIYFCCLEALQNAGKHASQAHVTIRIWEESGGLLFEVSDDGPGFDINLAKQGHGYVNMMDRLGAIGGAVRWESEIGRGTTIRGSVPIS